MHWALSIGKDEGNGGNKSKVFGTPGGKNQAKRGNQGKIFGRIFGQPGEMTTEPPYRIKCKSTHV